MPSSGEPWPISKWRNHLQTCPRRISDGFLDQPIQMWKMGRPWGSVWPLWFFLCLTRQLWGDVASTPRLQWGQSPAESEAAAGQRGQPFKASRNSSGTVSSFGGQTDGSVFGCNARQRRRSHGATRALGAWLSNFSWNNSCASTRRPRRSLACSKSISKITGKISFDFSWCVKMLP